MTLQLNDTRGRTRRGTTLIEVLVVIVILLIGILAVLQIFPGAFRVLSTTANNSKATALGRAEAERIKSRPDQLAEMILPVVYSFDGSNSVNIQVDDSRDPNNLGLIGSGIDGQGQVVEAGNSYGPWPYLAGANSMRRIVGEGGKIPAPRPVGQGSDLYGGFMVLQFSPMVYNVAYPELFQVYGNDMVRRLTENDPNGFRTREYDYFLQDVDEPDGVIWLPRGPTDRRYRLVISAWVNGPNGTDRNDVIDQIVPVPAGVGYASFSLSSYAGLQAGETYLGADYDSIRAARIFDEIPLNQPWSTNNVYEYKLLDSTLGTLLFNPNGYNFYVRQFGGNRVPLVARVNYDVYDWRIIRDEFRVAVSSPYQNKLILNNLRVQGSRGPDGRVGTGLNVLLPDGNGGVASRDFAVIDMETGGAFAPDSYRVDMSTGIVFWNDADAAPGLQLRLVYPGDTTPTVVDATGRSVRALYHATGEWTVQVLKAANRYRWSNANPGFGQFSVDRNSTRIFFPSLDNGKKVHIGEIWYRDGGGQLRLIENQDFLIRKNATTPLPFVDIREAAADAAAFDFNTYGYAVRNVKGASVAVRVMWNPAFFTLQATPAENLTRFEQWSQNWRKSTTETFLQRSDD